MRSESLRAWRERAAIAIVVGLLGGLVLGGYSVFQLAVSGFSFCQSSGCEDLRRAETAHYELLLHIALYGGGGLIVAGIALMRTLGKRLRALEPPPLPVATTVVRPGAGQDDVP